MNARPKVFILDDEPEIGQILSLFLETDFDVETFTDPRELIKRCVQGAFDVLISDIKMPHLNGLEVTKLVKEKLPEVPVILITGHAQSAEDQEAAKKAGASVVLFKPFGEPKAIVDIVQKTLYESKPSKAATGRRRIMIIDDEAMLSEVILLLIGDVYDVDCFVDPKQGLVNLPNKQYDCVLTDLSMPGMNGIQVISEIRKTNQSLPVLVLTGHDSQSNEVREALKAGANDLIPKPFPSSAALLQIIGNYVK